MRIAIALLVGAGALAVAGCTGGDAVPDGVETAAVDTAGGATATTTAAAPADTGLPDTPTEAAPSLPDTTETASDTAGEEAAAALGDFVFAAGSGDALVLWELLGEGARERLGPTFDAFQIGAARELEEGLGGFADSSYDVIVAAETAEGVSVVAISGVREAEGVSELAGYATVLRHERGMWKVDLGAPVGLSPALPGSGSFRAGERPPITVDVEAAAAIDEVLLWLDGEALDVTTAATGDGTKATVRGWSAEPLAAGSHVGVVFARAGSEAAAAAWVIAAR